MISFSISDVYWFVDENPLFDSADGCADVQRFEDFWEADLRRYCTTRVVSNRFELVAEMSLVFTDVPQGISTFYVFCISIYILVTQRILNLNVWSAKRSTARLQQICAVLVLCALKSSAVNLCWWYKNKLLCATLWYPGFNSAVEALNSLPQDILAEMVWTDHFI